MGSEELEKDVVLLKEKGLSIREIMDNKHIGYSKVKQILDKHGTKQNTPPPSPNPPGEQTAIDLPDGITVDQEILNGGVKGYVKQAGNYLSGELLQKYVRALKVSEILQGAEMRFRSGVESMGENWEDFLLESIELGYSKLIERERIWSIMKAIKNQD